jgi:hypothetical protein
MMRNAVFFSLGAVALTSIALLISILVHVVVDDSGSRVLAAETQFESRLTQMMPFIRDGMERLHVETIGLQLHPAENSTTFTLALTGYTGDNTTFTLLTLPTVDANAANDRWTSVLTPRGNGATLALNTPKNEVTTTVSDYTIPLKVEVDSYFQKGTRSILVFQLQVAASPTAYGLQDLQTKATNAAAEKAANLKNSKKVETLVNEYTTVLAAFTGIYGHHGQNSLSDYINRLRADATRDTLYALKVAFNSLNDNDDSAFNNLHSACLTLLDLDVNIKMYIGLNIAIYLAAQVVANSFIDEEGNETINIQNAAIRVYIQDGTPALTEDQDTRLIAAGGYTAWRSAQSTLDTYNSSLADSAMLKAVVAYADLTQTTEKNSLGIHLQVVASNSSLA